MTKIPRCFGKKDATGQPFWNASHPKCAGGNDPNFFENGSHKRPKCAFFDECGHKAQCFGVGWNANSAQCRPAFGGQTCPLYKECASAMNQLRPVVPATSLLQSQRSPMPGAAPVQPPMQPTPMVPQVLQQTRQVIHGIQTGVQQAQQRQVIPPAGFAQVPQYQQQASGQYLVPPTDAQMPFLVPQNHQAYGAQMPAYLTVPEPLNQPWWQMALWSILRAAGKASFHTMANVFDHVPFGSQPTNGQPTNGG